MPHASVADHGSVEFLAEIEVELERRLPIAAAARDVELVFHHTEGWRRQQSIRRAA